MTLEEFIEKIDVAIKDCDKNISDDKFTNARHTTKNVLENIRRGLDLVKCKSESSDSYQIEFEVADSIKTKVSELSNAVKALDKAVNNFKEAISSFNYIE